MRGGIGGDGDEDSWRARQHLKPEDQMDLTDSELCEEIPKVLSCENRNVPHNLVIYSFREGGYIPVPRTTNVVTIFEHEGTAIHIESVEAKAQIARDGGKLLLSFLKAFQFFLQNL